MFGVLITNAANNQIGDGSAAGRNLISGVSNLAGTGIYVTGASSIGNRICGNIIGLGYDGASLIGNYTNYTGIQITSSAGNTTIGGTAAGQGNVISGNYYNGIYINSTATSGNPILGNIIGIQADGKSVVGNQEGGITIDSSKNNIIGGSATGERNIISGNGNGLNGAATSSQSGIYITGSSTGNKIMGNYIGLDSSGTKFIAGSSQVYGVNIDATAANNTIGGTATGEGNVISGNTASGILLSSSANAGNNVYGNIIGTQKDGINRVVVNADSAQAIGVYFYNNSPNNIIGGSTTGARNIISGNKQDGILLSSGTGNTIQGNYIGLGATLDSIAGATQDGIYLLSNNNTIGGSATGEANIIAFNTGIGIQGASDNGNLISRNTIYGNSGIPIYYANNNSIPVITTVTTTTITGTSTAKDVVEVFKNTTGNCNDATTFLGSATADGSGNWNLAVTLTANDYVLATATDTNNSTSNFTTCVQPCIPPSVPTASNATICSGTTASLSATGTGTLGWYSAATNGTYLGSGATFTTPTLTVNTTYYVQDSTCAASATRKAIIVTVKTTPTLTVIATANTICAGSSTKLTASGASSYAWSGGITNNVSFTPSATTTYTVIGTAANTCTNTATKTIPVNNLPTVSVLSTNESAANACDGYLEALANGVAPYTYVWSDSSAVNSPYRYHECNGTYTVTVTDANTCSAKAKAHVGTDAVPAASNPLNISVTATDASNSTICNGTAVATVTGGDSTLPH